MNFGFNGRVTTGVDDFTTDTLTILDIVFPQVCKNNKKVLKMRLRKHAHNRIYFSNQFQITLLIFTCRLSDKTGEQGVSITRVEVNSGWNCTATNQG